MAKTLYLIGGTMGIGKTTVCRILKKRLPNAVLLDGDWCWDADPFIVTEETKAMVMDNITHMLNGFLHCSAYENVIFCWVMHQQPIVDAILSKLDTQDVRVQCISLICSPEALEERLRQDVDAGIRTADVIGRSLPRLKLYADLNTIKLNVTGLTPEETADVIETL